MADKAFGDNLSKSRKKAGLSQEELAEKMGITRQTISKWETGASVPDVEELQRLCGLCAALSASAEELICGEAGRKPKREHLDLFQCFFYGFLVVMFITGACVRMANQISIETYHPSITTAARVMMLIPVVTFFAMAVGRILGKKKLN